MTPNFKGVCNYNPESNPLKDLSREEINDFCFAYMEMWYNQEEFTDFNIIYDAGDAEMCADWLVNAGAIDSDNCHESCRQIEEVIEVWAKDFDKLGLTKKRKRQYEVFKDSVSFGCNDCNHVSVVNDGNEKLYEFELKTCWECESPNIHVSRWEK